MSDLFDIPLKRIDGTPTTLAAYSGKVLLIVNVASKCGLTPQYTALEQLYKAEQAAGLEILGFPANNFASQEPGENEEIAQFCTLNYGVSFPMFAKISVNGEDRHPFYRALIAEQPKATEHADGAFRKKLAGYGITQEHPEDVFWNFEKFLISRKGNVVGRFAPDITPDDPLITDAIKNELSHSS